MSSLKNDPSLYDAYYFRHNCGAPYERSATWLDFFSNVADAIVSGISPRTVFDAGCAMGFLIEALRRRGVQAWGVDISEYAIDQVHPDVRPYCKVGSILEPLNQKYDLIACIEVVEHLPLREAERAILNLCEHTDDVLFSSSPSDYKETTHLNVQPTEYWAELFAHQSFYRDVDFDASVITPWATRFRRRGEPIARIVREYERKFWLLWKENVDLREVNKEMRDEAKRREESVQGLSRSAKTKN